MKKETFWVLLQSFLPILVFYAFEHFFGLKLAIAGTIVVAVAEIIYRKYKSQELGSVFWFVTGTTIVFGLIDVFSTEMRFLKFEASLTNLITGIYMTWGAMTPKPMLLELAQKTGKIPENPDPVFVDYLRVVTWIWAIYFFGKTIQYFILALRPETDLMKMLTTRAVEGNLSMILMAGFTLVIAKPLLRYLKRRRARLDAQALEAQTLVKEKL